MNNGGLTRIKYYKGQILTARDFDDQQEYHRQKQKLLLQRFPPGIIKGLEVVCPGKSNEFVILAGLAVDQDGNEIIVTGEGLKVPVTEFKPEKPYLSIYRVEVDASAGNDSCGASKSNRIKEEVGFRWDAVPNTKPSNSDENQSITVALIKLVDETDKPGPTCDFYTVIQTDELGGPHIRINAGLVGADQITDGVITAEKIRTNAVTSEKIKDDAVIENKIKDGVVIESKLGDGVKARLVTGGDLHDHTGDQGGLIPEDGLQSTVKGKLVTNGDGHNHSGGHGGLIPENGLQSGVTDKLVLNGSNHDHSGGDGALIPEAGLDPAVQAKLNAIVGTNHNHTGGQQGALIPENGLVNNVRAKLVTGGNNHNHSAGNGAPISEAGLAAAVQAKLVTSGNGHDHTAGNGALIPEAGLAAAVQAKLVTSGNGHDHTAGNGALIPKDGLANGAVTPEKLNLITVLANRTFDPGDGDPLHDDVPINGVSPNALIQIIPTAGTISWIIKAEFVTAGSLNYLIKITNESGGLAGYQIRAITFN